MKRCDFCRIEINGAIEHCPLCFRSLKKTEDICIREYPEYKKLDKTILSFRSKILLFVFISVSSISLLVNLMVWTGTPWFLYVVTSLFYIWILIHSTIAGRGSYGAKLILQLIGLSVLVVVIDLMTKRYNWSVNYVIPGVLILANLIITIRIISRKPKWRDYSVFLILLLLMGFIPLILCGFGIITVLWPAVASSLYAILTFLAFLIFSPRRFRRELNKIFHM